MITDHRNTPQEPRHIIRMKEVRMKGHIRNIFPGGNTPQDSIPIITIFCLKEKQKKQLILRLPASLWQDIAIWAEEDLRSINSQIEYILKQAVNQHKK